MFENLVGTYAEITKKRATIRVREVDEDFELPPFQTPIQIEGGIALTRPFRVRFGVFITINNKSVVLRLNKDGLLDDFNDDLTSLNLMLEVFTKLNLQLAVIDEENGDRIIILPENNEAIIPYFDAVSEIQLETLKKIDTVFKYYNEDFQIGRLNKTLKEKLVEVSVSNDSIDEDYIKAIVVPSPRKNIVDIIYPLDVKLDPDEVSFIALEPLASPVFLSRISGLKFIKDEAFTQRVIKSIKQSR